MPELQLQPGEPTPPRRAGDPAVQDVGWPRMTHRLASWLAVVVLSAGLGLALGLLLSTRPDPIPATPPDPWPAVVRTLDGTLTTVMPEDLDLPTTTTPAGG